MPAEIDLDALRSECVAKANDIWKLCPSDNAMRRRIVDASETLKKAAKLIARLESAESRIAAAMAIAETMDRDVPGDTFGEKLILALTGAQ